ncbi:MAG: AAA family ATPase [bacterium]|nr:AAA family ATPase [bacterium]
MSVLYEFLDCELDESRYQLRRQGQPVELEPKVFEVLAYLIRARDRVVSKRELLDRLWPDRIVGEWSLTRCISLARKAVHDNPSRQSIIQTVYGRGYRFVAEVTDRTSAGTVAGSASISEVSIAPVAPDDPFVGRSAELAEVGLALDSALAGRGRLVFLLGENGIGKSRLAQEVASIASEAGAVARLGQCWEVEGTPAFYPWMQIVCDEARSRGGRATRLLMGRRAAEITRVVPDLHEILDDLAEAPALEPLQERFRVFEAITYFLKRSAKERPLVLLLDDLQRADIGSLRLLEFLSREIFDSRILMICSYREAELNTSAERARMVAELSRSGSAQQFRLGGLTVADVRAFAAQLPGPPASEDLVAVLHRHTGGNPFFLKQMLPLVAGDAENSWLDPDHEVRLPEGMRQATLRQLDGLSEDCRTALIEASVMGCRFDSATLARASMMDEAKLREYFDEAERAGIVIVDREDPGRFEFAHGIVRDTLYADLAASERSASHCRLGEAIEGMVSPGEGGRVAELARHFAEAAASGGEKKAFDYAIAAGRWSTDGGAFEEACRFLSSALHLAERIESVDEGQQCDLLLDLGDAQMHSRDVSSARDTLQRASVLARRLEDPERLARVALGVSNSYMPLARAIVDERIVSLLEEALEALDEGDSSLRALTLSSLAGSLYWSGVPQRVAQLVEEALEMARRLDDPPTLLFTLSVALITNLGPDLIEHSIDLAEEAVRLGEQVGVKREYLDARVQRMIALFSTGEFETFDLELRKLVSLTSDMCAPEAHEFIPFFEATRAIMSGRFEAAEGFVDELLARSRRMQDEVGNTGFGMQVLSLRGLQGASEEYVEVARNLAEHHTSVPLFRCALARGYCDLDQPGLARGEVDRLAARDFTGIYKNISWLCEMALLAETCALLGDEPRCLALYEILSPYAHRYVTSGAVLYMGSVQRYLGVLATVLRRFNIASGHFLAAEEMESLAGARPWMAWAQNERARMLMIRNRDGDRLEAEALAARALGTARDLGMRSLERRVLSIS